MGFIRGGLGLSLVLVLLCAIFQTGLVGVVNAQDTLVPALILFGDSAVDVGNNNYIHTLFKANYPPYGRDFINHQATGRFSNGKIATDYTADTLGFKTYPLPYLSPEANGKNLLIGANFASAAAGYDEKASAMNHAITLPNQLALFKEYKTKLAKVAGQTKADSIIKDSLYILGAGSGDFVQNYYINPLVNKVYTVDQYSNTLITSFNSFIQNLYAAGARKIGVTSLPPLGCLPAVRTLFGYHQPGCVARINADAQLFNKKLNNAASSILKQHSDLRMVVFDIFTPIYDIVKTPSKYGFKEATRGCCGTGTVELTSVLCNPHSIGTCSNATQYVFFDAVHPSDEANRIVADSLLIQGLSLI